MNGSAPQKIGNLCKSNSSNFNEVIEKIHENEQLTKENAIHVKENSIHENEQLTKENAIPNSGSDNSPKETCVNGCVQPREAGHDRSNGNVLADSCPDNKSDDLFDLNANPPSSPREGESASPPSCLPVEQNSADTKPKKVSPADVDKSASVDGVTLTSSPVSDHVTKMQQHTIFVQTETHL